MKNTVSEPVNIKFTEMFSSFQQLTDELKLEAAEFNLTGDFELVTELNAACRSLHEIEANAHSVLNNFGSIHKTALTRQPKSKKNHRRTRTPQGRLRVTIGDKVIEEPTTASTFAKTIDVFGLERVARLNKTLSAAPLVSKKPLPSSNYQKQIKMRDWYITAHVNNLSAKRLLKQISTELKIRIRVDTIAP